MTQKLKTIGLAFSGLIVYSALLTSTQYIFDNHIIAKLVAGIAFMILGGAYTKVVLGPYRIISSQSRKFLLTALAVVLLYCFVSLFTSNCILYHITDESYMQQAADAASLAQDMMILSSLMSVFLAPVVEELVFRGCLYRFLAQLSKEAAVFVSSLIFALFHGTIVHMYAAFFGGFIFCCIYEKTGKLRFSILAHMIFNAVTIVISMISYADFVTEIWWSAFMNSLFFLSLVVLCMTSNEPEVKTAAPELTEQQKLERERTKKIVAEVLDEYKRH